MPLFNPAGEVVTFTPSWGGLTIGSSVTAGTLVRIGKLVIFRAELTAGASFAMANPSWLNLPTTAAAAPLASQIECHYQDTGTGQMRGTVEATSMTTTRTGDFAVLAASGTYASLANVSSTVPFSWNTSTDRLMVSGWYIEA